MSISIKEAGATTVVLEFGQDKIVMTHPVVQEAVMAFTVLDRTSTTLTLDVSPNLTEAAVFLLDAFRASGADVHLTPALARLLEAQQQEKSIVDRVRASTTPVDDAPAPPSIPGFVQGTAMLWHQVRGLKKALVVENLAEFSVQGSGKTLTALAAFRTWKTQGLLSKLLVIGRSSSRKPWEDEISRWLGTVPVLRWSGAASQRLRFVPLYEKVDIVLCTYDTAIRDGHMLANLLREYPTFLVLDESHYIKNFDGGARVDMALRLAPLAVRRMILTGTPAPHSLLDIWNQFAFLWPTQIDSILGPRPVFRNRIQQTADLAGSLGQHLQPFFHRTTQDELALPEPHSHFVKIPDIQIPPEQIRILRLLEARLLSELNSMAAAAPDKELVLRWRKARIVRMLQAASNPGLLARTLPDATYNLNDIEMGDLSGEIAKFRQADLLASKVAWAVDKARDLISNGQKVIIWTWWVDNLWLLAKLLEEANPLVVYGGIKPYQDDWDDEEEISRERNIAKFRADPNSMLLLANPAACAESISLHRECHHAIYLDRTFNCGQFLQSMNRIHRVGLPVGTTTHYWIPYLDCAIERSVNQRLTARQTLMYKFLNDPAAVLGFDEDDEAELSDTADEVEAAFATLANELRSSPT